MERARKANDLRASICPIRPTYDVATSSLPKSTQEMGQTFELGRNRLLIGTNCQTGPAYSICLYRGTIFGIHEEDGKLQSVVAAIEYDEAQPRTGQIGQAS
jgi:hypothetical protein